ncbi:MAG: hypothetical protein DMG51_09685 [Acidobacteria bacterium]|nr:MAG: hypothetical protein DMG51_09685 [Acidobacteriota bacterium]
MSATASAGSSVLTSLSTAAERRFQTLLLSVFFGAALVLSLVGLYALLAYSVRQRTAELGIRLALGSVKDRPS